MEFSARMKSIWNGLKFSYGIRRALVNSLALVYFIHIGFDVVWITTLFAISSIASMFLEFPTGAIADYDSRKKSLVISFLLFAISFLGIYFGKSFWLIAIFWFLSDVAWTFCTGADSAWIIDTLGIEKSKSKIVRLISRGYVFEKGGRILGGAIGFLIISISFRLIWLVSGLSSLLMGLIIWRYAEERNFLPERIPHNYLMKSWIKAKEAFSFIIHKKNLNLRVLMLSSMSANIGLGIFYLAVPLFFVQILGMGAEFYSGLLGGIAFLSLISPFIAEKMVKKSGIRKLLFGIYVISGILIVIFANLNSLILAIILFSIFEVLLVIFDVLDDSALHHEFDSKIRASLGSVSSINWNVSNSIGVFLAGIGIRLFGVVPTLIISGGIVFLTAFAYLLMKEKDD